MNGYNASDWLRDSYSGRFGCGASFSGPSPATPDAPFCPHCGRPDSAPCACPEPLPREVEEAWQDDWRARCDAGLLGYDERDGYVGFERVMEGTR